MLPIYGNMWFPEVFNSFIETRNQAKCNVTNPTFNVTETDESYSLEFAVPGIKKEDVDVKVSSDANLTIKVESKKNEESVNDKKKYLRKDFSYAKYERTFLLPEDVDRSLITAKVNDGILTVALPKVVKNENKVARDIVVD